MNKIMLYIALGMSFISTIIASTPELINNLTAWELVDEDDRVLSFELINEDDVHDIELDIIFSSPLPSDASLEDLKLEIQNRLNDSSEDTPILNYIMDFSDDDEDEDDEDEDEDDDLDDEESNDDTRDIDLDELTLMDVSEMTTCTINGIDWVSFQYTQPIVTTVYWNGPSYVSNVSYSKCYVFIAEIQRCIYFVEFNCPVDIHEEYLNYEDRILEDMKIISNHIENL